MRRVAERALYHEHVLARLDFPAANAQQHVVHPVEAVADGQLGQAGLHAGAAFVRRPPKLAVERVHAGGAALVERVAGVGGVRWVQVVRLRSEEHTSELQSLMRISYAVFCLKKKKRDKMTNIT